MVMKHGRIIISTSDLRIYGFAWVCQATTVSLSVVVIPTIGMTIAVMSMEDNLPDISGGF